MTAPTKQVDGTSTEPHDGPKDVEMEDSISAADVETLADHPEKVAASKGLLIAAIRVLKGD